MSSTKTRSSRFQRQSDSEGSVAASSLAGSKVIIDDTFDDEPTILPDPSPVHHQEGAGSSRFASEPKSRFVAGKGDGKSVTPGGREVLADNPNLWQTLGKKGGSTPTADDPDARAAEQLIKSSEAKSAAPSNPIRASAKSDLERILACSLRVHYATVNPARQSEEQLAAAPCPLASLLEFSADMRKAYRQTGKQEVLDHYFQEVSSFFVTLVVPRVTVPNEQVRSSPSKDSYDAADDAIAGSSDDTQQGGAWKILSSRSRNNNVHHVFGESAHAHHCVRFPVLHDPTWSVSKNKNANLVSVAEPTELRRCVRAVSPPDLASWVPLPALANAARSAALKQKGEQQVDNEDAMSPEAQAICNAAFEKITSLFKPLGVPETAKLVNHLSYFYSEWQMQERVREARKALSLNASGVPPQLLVGATEEQKALLTAAHKAAPLGLQFPLGEDSSREQTSSGWGEASIGTPDDDGMPPSWASLPLPPVITASLPNAVPAGPRAIASRAIKKMPLSDAAKEFEMGPFGFPVPKTSNNLVDGDTIDSVSANKLLRKYHSSVALSPRHHNAAMGILFSNLALKFVALSYRDLTPIGLSLSLLAVSSLSVGNVSKVRLPGFEAQYLPLLLAPLAKDNTQHRGSGSTPMGGGVSRLELTAVSASLSKIDKFLSPKTDIADITKQTFLPTVLKGLFRQSSPMRQAVSWIRRNASHLLADLSPRSPIDACSMLCLMIDYDNNGTMLLHESKAVMIADVMRNSHNLRMGQSDAPAFTSQVVKQQIFTHISRSVALTWLASIKSTAEDISDTVMHKTLGAALTPLMEGFFEGAYADIVSLPAAVGRIQSGGAWAHQHIKQPHRDEADVDPMDVDGYVNALEVRFNCVVFLGAYLMSGDVYSRIGPDAYFALVATLRSWTASVLTSLATSRRLCALGASISELASLPSVTQQVMLTTDPSFRAGLDAKLLPLKSLAQGAHRTTIDRMHTQLVYLLSPAPYRSAAESSTSQAPGIATHRNMHALLTAIPGEEKYTGVSTKSTPNPNSTTITTITSVSAVSAGTVARAVAGLRTLPSLVMVSREAVQQWDGSSTLEAVKTTIDPLKEEASGLVDDEMDIAVSEAATATKSAKTDSKTPAGGNDARSLASLCTLALRNILGCDLGSVPSVNTKQAEKELISKGIGGIVKKLSTMCAESEPVAVADLHASLVSISLLSAHSHTGLRQFLNLVSPQAQSKSASRGPPNAAADRYEAIRKQVLAAMKDLPLEALGAASTLKIITSEEIANEIKQRLSVHAKEKSSFHQQVRSLLEEDGILSTDTPNLQSNLNNFVDSLARAAFELRRDIANVGYRALCEIVVEVLAVRTRYEYITATSNFVRRRLREVSEQGIACVPSDFESEAASQTKLGEHIRYAAVEDLPYRIGLKINHRPERQHFGTGAYMLVHCLSHYSFVGWYMEREASIRKECLERFKDIKQVSNAIPCAASAAQQALLNSPPSSILYQPPRALLREATSATPNVGDDSDLTPGLVAFDATSQIEALLWQDRRLLCSAAVRQAYLCGRALQNGHERLLFWVGSLGDQLLKPVGAKWCVGGIPLHCTAAKKSDEGIRPIPVPEMMATEGRDAASLQSLILQSIEGAQQSASIASFKRVAHAVALLNSCGAQAEVGVSLLTISNRLYSDRKLFVAGAVYDYVVACSLHLSTIPNISLVLGHLRHEKLTNDEMKHVFRGITVAAENEAVTSHQRATIVDLAKKVLIADSISLQCATLRALAITRCGSSSVFRQLSALVVLKRHLLSVDEVGDAVSCAKYTDLADDVLSSGLREELVKRIPLMPWDSTRALLPWMASAFIGDKELWTLVVRRYTALEGQLINDPVLIASLCESANSDLAQLPQHVMSSVASK